MCHMLCPDDRAITLFALGLPLASTRRTSPSRRPRYEANMMVVSWPRYAYHMSSIFLHTHSALKLNRVSAISKATCRSAQGTCITFHPRKSSFAPVVPVFVCLSRTLYTFARMRACAADRCFPHIRVFALTILGSMTCPQNKCHPPSYSSRTTPHAVLFVCPLYCPMAIELRTVPAPRMRSIRLSHRNIFHSPLSDVFVYCILLLPSLQAPCILSYLISTYLGL